MRFLTGLLFLCLNLTAGSDTRLILGQTEGIGQLFALQTARLGPEEKVYAFDGGDAFFKVYGPNGSPIRRLGGKGEGPGEVKRPAVRFSFSRNGMSLLWTEFWGGHIWVTKQPLAGGKAAVIPLDYKKDTFKGLWGVEELPGGGYLVQTLVNGGVRQQADCFFYSEERALHRIDETGKTLGSIQKVLRDTGISFIHDGATITLPFTPPFSWCLNDKGQVLYGDGLSSELEVLDLRGQRMGTIKLDLEPASDVTDPVMSEWRESMRKILIQRDKGWYDRFGKVIDRYQKSCYPLVPLYESFMLTPEGNILVRPQPGWGGKTGPTRLFSPSGKELARLQGSGRIYDISRRFILYGYPNQDGDLELGLLQRRGSEASDLVRLGEHQE